MSKKPLQIAILEMNATIQETLKSKYDAIFQSAGYETSTEVFDNQDKLFTYLHRKLVHVLIADISLGQTRNMIGLSLIQRVKENYPDIFVIGNSRKDIGHRLSSYRTPSFDIFVDKGVLINERLDYDMSIRRTFLERFRRNTSITLDKVKVTGPAPFKPGREEVEFISLLQQILFTTHDNSKDLAINEVLLTPLSGGRSKSLVFKMTLRFGKDLNGVSTVIKISDRAKGNAERQNYDTYVRWLLPFQWRPEALGFAQTQSKAAICYSFVVVDENEFDSLTGFLARSEFEKLEHVVENIMSPSNQAWYNKELVKNEKSISKRYLDRYFEEERWAAEAEDTLRENITRFFAAVIRDDGFEVDGQMFPLPVEMLFAQRERAYASCILHGDLNSSNIIMSKDLRNMVFIDFQDTGRGHVFEDFITLESSIRIYHPRLSSSFLDLFREEGALLNRRATRKQGGYSHYIKRIRDAALGNFDDPELNYQFGVAAYGLRLMRIVALDDLAKARISASVLWASRALREG